MRCAVVTLLALLSLPTATASAQITQVQVAYDTYATGVEVMQLDAFFGLGPWNYHIDLDYHTTGLVGLLYRGRQTNTVRGVWEDERAEPSEFFGEGVWRGRRRRTLIGYTHGLPQIKELSPPQESEREPVPPDLQLHSMDTLSALAQLMRKVQRRDICETSVRTYDGRRVLEIVAHTGGGSGSNPPPAPSSAGQRCAATSRGANWQASCWGKTIRSTTRRSTVPPGSHRCWPARRPCRCASPSRRAGSAGRRCISPQQPSVPSVPRFHMLPRIARAHSSGLRNTDFQPLRAADTADRREQLHSHTIATHVSSFHQVPQGLQRLWVDPMPATAVRSP